MSFTPGGLYFEEFSDSPKIKLGQQLVSATRVFLCNWSDWQAMCYELIGIWRIFGLATIFIPPISFPGVPLMVVSEVDVEPFDGHSPQPGPVDLGAFTNVYKIAKITAQYSTLSYQPDRPDQPNTPEGTILNYSSDHGAEVMTLPNRSLYWGTLNSGTFAAFNQLPVGEDSRPGLIVPTAEINLAWKRVLQPPWEAIKETRGKINQASFFSNEPGTVLFLGSKESRTFQFGQQPNQGQLWDIDYKFSVKSNKLADGVTVVGWNYSYFDGDVGGIGQLPEHWNPIGDLNNKQPYESGDFDALFEFGEIVMS